MGCRVAYGVGRERQMGTSGGCGDGRVGRGEKGVGR